MRARQHFCSRGGIEDRQPLHGRAGRGGKRLSGARGSRSRWEILESALRDIQPATSHDLAQRSGLGIHDVRELLRIAFKNGQVKRGIRQLYGGYVLEYYISSSQPGGKVVGQFEKTVKILL